MNPALALTPMTLAFVALGGGLGCMLRFAAINLVIRINPGMFPFGTMLVNIVGSLAIGVLLARFGGVSSLHAFFVTGMLGGFTTFSAFSWDMLSLLQRGEYLHALLYALGSVLLSLGAVALGYYFAGTR
jgi:CrcB protein